MVNVGEGMSAVTEERGAERALTHSGCPRTCIDTPVRIRVGALSVALPVHPVLVKDVQLSATSRACFFRHRQLANVLC